MDPRLPDPRLTSQLYDAEPDETPAATAAPGEGKPAPVAATAPGEGKPAPAPTTAPGEGKPAPQPQAPTAGDRAESPEFHPLRPHGRPVPAVQPAGAHHPLRPITSAPSIPAGTPADQAPPPYDAKGLSVDSDLPLPPRPTTSRGLPSAGQGRSAFRSLTPPTGGNSPLPLQRGGKPVDPQASFASLGLEAHGPQPDSKTKNQTTSSAGPALALPAAPPSDAKAVNDKHKPRLRIGNELRLLTFGLTQNFFAKPSDVPFNGNHSAFLEMLQERFNLETLAYIKKRCQIHQLEKGLALIELIKTFCREVRAAIPFWWGQVRSQDQMNQLIAPFQARAQELYNSAQKLSTELDAEFQLARGNHPQEPVIARARKDLFDQHIDFCRKVLPLVEDDEQHAAVTDLAFQHLAAMTAIFDSAGRATTSRSTTKSRLRMDLQLDQLVTPENFDFGIEFFCQTLDFFKGAAPSAQGFINYILNLNNDFEVVNGPSEGKEKEEKYPKQGQQPQPGAAPRGVNGAGNANGVVVPGQQGPRPQSGATPRGVTGAGNANGVVAPVQQDPRLSPQPGAGPRALSTGNARVAPLPPGLAAQGVNGGGRPEAAPGRPNLRIDASRDPLPGTSEWTAGGVPDAWKVPGYVSLQQHLHSPRNQSARRAATPPTPRQASRPGAPAALPAAVESVPTAGGGQQPEQATTMKLV